MSTTEIILATVRRRRSETEHTDTLNGWLAFLSLLHAVGADDSRAPIELRLHLGDATRRANEAAHWNTEMMELEAQA